MSSDSKPTVTVIGAGIVGLCCARTLQRQGHPVVVIDRDEPGTGTSYGNAGLLAQGSVLPEGRPGLWKRVPGMLMDPLGPLSIRWSYLPRLAPYLVRLLAASRPERVEEISRALSQLVRPGLDSYLSLMDDIPERHDLIRRTGNLYVYPTEAALAAAVPEIALRRQRGIEVQELGPDEIRQMVPAFGPRMAGGAFVPASAQTVNPLRLSQTLAEAIVRAGGTIKRARVHGFEMGPQGPVRVRTSDGDLPVERLVIAAGAFSRDLARTCGSDVPLDTERGYHVMLPDPGIDVRVPMLIGALGFAVTPMEHGVRLAGTVEFAGLDAPPNYARADVLLKHAQRLFPDVKSDGAERWMGRRPSLPDSLPVISQSPRHRSVFFAFGHGHLGLSLAAVTGRMIADMVAGKTPAIDPAPYRIDRF